MSTIFTVQFLHPEWLLLIPPAWAIIAWFSLGVDSISQWEKICDTHLINHIRRTDARHDRRWPLISILTLLITLALVAAAGPSWQSIPQPLTESGKARVVALELSQQMLVQDIKPNRFNRALDATRAVINSGFDGETGLIVFSGSSFVVSPLSRDASTLLAFLDQLDPKIMPLDGERIDSAIDSAHQLLKASIAGRGEIYIVTAGTEFIDAAVQASLRASRQGSQTSVLAVGSAAGGPRVDLNGNLIRDKEGRYLLSKTRFDQLERIALASGGRFLQIRSSAIPASFFAAQLTSGSQYDKTPGTDAGEKVAVNNGFWIVWLLLPLCLLLFRRNLLFSLPLILILPVHNDAFAADPVAFWKNQEQQAYRAYVEQDYQQAVELSREPLLSGAAHYRLGNFSKALNAFKSQESAISFFNQGNAHAQLEQFPEAIQAYDRALEINPAYADAAYNRDLVSIYLKQQSATEGSGTEGDEADSQSNESEQSSAQAQLGSMGSEQSNPADDQQPGSGIGASSQLSLLEDSEPFSGREEQTEGLPPGLRPGEVIPEQELIEGWIRSLPQASSELFRRKFLRDYERQALPQR